MFWTASTTGEDKDEGSSKWKDSFLKAPYFRDHFVRMGCIMETFETAVTWDKFEQFHETITTVAKQKIKEIAGAGFITCRFTHLYPDGPAPYYTIIARGQSGLEIDQWDEIKQAVSDAIIEMGGTITHHHAVGRDHRDHYVRQASEIFIQSMQAVKNQVDPSRILNPGVLLP